MVLCFSSYIHISCDIITYDLEKLFVAQTNDAVLKHASSVWVWIEVIQLTHGSVFLDQLATVKYLKVGAA